MFSKIVKKTVLNVIFTFATVPTVFSRVCAFTTGKPDSPKHFVSAFVFTTSTHVYQGLVSLLAKRVV